MALRSYEKKDRCIKVYDPLHNQKPARERDVRILLNGELETQEGAAIICQKAYLTFFLNDLFRNIPVTSQEDPLLGNTEKMPAISLRTQSVVDYCQRLLPEILTQPAQPISTKQYEAIKRAIVDVYLLTAPCVNPNEHTAIVDAKKRTDLPQLSDEGQIWLPEIQNDAWQDDRLKYKPVHELSPMQRRVILLWWEYEIGLLDHTLIAAEFIRQLVRRIKSQLKSQIDSGFPLNQAQQQVVEYDENLIATKMLFHDMGRLITHDRIGHERMTQEILEQAGIHADWREEPSIIHHFTSEYPTSVWDIDSDNPIGLLYHFADVVSKGNEHIKRPSDILDQLHKRKAHYQGNGQNAEQLRHTPNGYYSDFESKMVQEILWWMEDEKGLNFPREKLLKVYKKVEKYMHRMRRGLGLRAPYSSE